MTPRIYTAYHKSAPLLESDIVTPIHVGRALHDKRLPGMIGDDTGDNISAKNQGYCELTALYWAWKNDRDATHIGLMHYRRVLDYDNAHSGQAETFVARFDIPDWLDRTETWLGANADVDLVLPRPHVMGRTLAENFRTRHRAQDWDRTREIIAERYPEDLADFDKVSAAYEIRLGNMFIMRRALFDAYCGWLFDILERLEATPLDRETYSPEQSRYIGFVAERLFTVWVEKIKRDQPELRLHETGILNMSRAVILPWMTGPALNGPEHVNVAFAADRDYLPHTAAMLASLLEHADPKRVLNLFFLHSDVGEAARAMLREVLIGYPNARLHEMNAGATFDEAYRSKSRAPSNTTYNRFLLFDLLPDIERLLYVDVDMIFRGDVAQIFDTEMGDHPLGAVTDHIMTRTLTGTTPTIDPAVPDLYDYHRQTLGLNDAQIARYFNAGLLLFNFKAMDVKATGAALMKMALEGQYMFRDQDVMNAFFKDSVLTLDARYNVLNTVIEGYNRVPKANHAEAMAARRDPVVIHYAAGDYKPWNEDAVPMAAHYWHALMRTPFFAEVTSGMQSRASLRTRGTIVRGGIALANRFPALRPFLMRTYAQIRRVR
ncbi:DUF4422 domain-containing protein [Sulfitobacter sp. D35]|nr:DUF4422 domain-containing protein [Sulfitobacter sp. D35]